jgi:hypothetical protein
METPNEIRYRAPIPPAGLSASSDRGQQRRRRLPPLRERRLRSLSLTPPAHPRVLFRGCRATGSQRGSQRHRGRPALPMGGNDAACFRSRSDRAYVDEVGRRRRVSRQLDRCGTTQVAESLSIAMIERRFGAANATSWSGLGVEEMAGLGPDFTAFRSGGGAKRASGREPKPGLRFEPVVVVLESAFDHRKLDAARRVEHNGLVWGPAFEPNVLAAITKQGDQFHAWPGRRRRGRHRLGVNPDLRAVLRIYSPPRLDLSTVPRPLLEPSFELSA